MNRYLKLMSPSGLGGTMITQVIIMLAGIGSGVTLARSLGPSARGELAIALLWPNILVLLADLGLGFAFAYYVGKGRANIDSLWTLSLLAGSVLGGVAAVLGWFVVPYFVPSLQGSARAAFGIALLSVPVIITSNYQSFLLLGSECVSYYNLVRLVLAAGYLFSVGAVAALGLTSVRCYVVAYLLSQIVGLCLSSALAHKQLRPRFHIDAPLIPRLLSYGFRTQLSSIAEQTNLRADQAMMSVILTPRQLGQYVVAVAISGVLTPLLNALAIVIIPRASHARNEMSGGLIVVRHVKLACLFCLPVLLVSIVAMPWALPLFFGREYMPSVRSAQILVAAGLFQGLNSVLANSLRGLGRPSLPAIAEGSGMAATFLLLFWLMPMLGILGAALASLIAYACVGVIEMIFVARTAGMNTFQLLATPMDFPVVGRSKQFLRALVSR